MHWIPVTDEAHILAPDCWCKPKPMQRCGECPYTHSSDCPICGGSGLIYAPPGHAAECYVHHTLEAIIAAERL